jgi:hypothetical protein
MSWNRNRVLVYRQAPLSRSGIEGAAARTTIAASPDKVRVGIWDLDASAGALPTLLDRIDEAQPRFSFNSVEAPFPSGLTVPGIGAMEDWREYTGKVMDPHAAQFNVAARPIFTAAAPVLEKLPIEWLIVVVKSMIADSSDPKDSWYNLFSTTSGNIVLISAFEVREYAAEARRSFEAGVFGMVLSGLLSAMIPGIKYQKKSTGSIFDFCEQRADIVKSFRKPQIDPENRARIPQELLGPVDTMLEVLTRYKGGAALRKPRGKAPVVKKSRAAANQPAAPPFTVAKRPLGFSGKSSAPAAASKQPATVASSFLGELKSLDETIKKMSSFGPSPPAAPTGARRAKAVKRRK